MQAPKFLDEVSSRLSALVAQSPARDLERNARALLGSAFSHLDLVTREEFDVQRELLAHTRQKLTELEQRIALLEARQTEPSSPGQA